MNNDNFDDIIKQKTNAHEAPVPADAWDNISKKKKRKLIPFFWWSLSSLLVIAILFFYIYSIETKNNLSAINSNNQPVKSLSKPDSTNNDPYLKTEIRTADENKNLNKNIIQTQQTKNDSSKQNDVNIANHATTTQQKELNETQATAELHKKEPSLLTNENQATTSIHAKGKMHLYKRKAKFKSTITNGSADSETADKINADANNDNNFTDTNTRQSNKKDIISIQKNDSLNDNATLIKEVQKKPGIDSSAKTKNTSSTKINEQTKTVINAGKKIKYPALILDFSVTPYSPVQRYDQPESITRVISNNSTHSFYSASSIQTSLQSFIAFAIDIKKNISKKLVIGIGIQYSQISENIHLSGQETDTAYSPIQRLETNSGGPYLKNDTIINTTIGVRTIKAVNSYKLFSVPLFITYNFFNSKLFSLGFTGGVYFTFAQYQNSIDGKLKSQYANEPLADNEKNNLAMDIFGGLHLSFNVSKKFQLFAEPNYRYNVNRYELKNTFLNKNINQAGISFGVSYSIK